MAPPFTFARRDHAALHVRNGGTSIACRGAEGSGPSLPLPDPDGDRPGLKGPGGAP